MPPLPPIIRPSSLDLLHGLPWLAVPAGMVVLCLALLYDSTRNLRASVEERLPSWRMRLIRGRRFRDWLAMASSLLNLAAFAVAPLCQTLIAEGRRIFSRDLLWTAALALLGVARLSEGWGAFRTRRANRPAARREAARRMREGWKP